MNNKELAERSRASFGKIWKQAMFALAALATLGVLLYSLTTAWYTNVAETTELVFETESWGFEGQVKTVETALQLAPGQNACAELSITNEGEQINQITVTVDKSSMPEELQKRIYFYVPATVKQHEETVECVYLSTYGGYSYRVMPKSTLLLTADSAADAPVRCQWVYDLLGYYVYGTLDKDNKLITAEQIKAGNRTDVAAPVYIRPVEYDYDKAIFQDDKLLTVGEDKVEHFVQALLAADGYKNADTTTTVGDYYAVNTTGTSGTEQTGLWLYLCTQTEIEAATKLDTRIGTYRYLLERKDEQGNSIPLTDEQTKEYKDVATLLDGAKATIQIAGQNLRMDVTDVTTAESLTAELSQGKSVRLAGDMTLEGAVVIPADKDVVIDLNGKKLTTNLAEKPVLEGTPGSSITVLNGTIDGGNRDTAVQLVGSSVAFSGVTVRGGLHIDDGDEQNTEKLTSVVRLSNCTLQTTGDKKPGITVLGNGTSASSRTVLLVENSTIESAYVGIVGSGAVEQGGTDIQIMGSTVKGTQAGIYHPQQESRLTVQDGSTLEGETGIVVKGGRVNVLDSAVHAVLTTGSRPTEEQLAQSGGWHNAGAGIYVEATGDRAEEIAVTIAGSTISSAAKDLPGVLIVGEKADAVRANSDFTDPENQSLTIG